MNVLFPEAQPPQFDGEAYIESVREVYQDGNIHYTGRRSPEQRDIALLLGDEADEFIDGAAQMVRFMAGDKTDSRRSPEDYLADEFDDTHSEKYVDMRSAFRQLYVAIGIATHRMHDRGITTRGGNQLTSLIELSDEDRRTVLGSLFADFQELNALRFGAKGSGIPRFGRLFIETDADGVDQYEVKEIGDKDVMTPSRLWRHMQRVNYRERFGNGDEEATGDGLPMVHAAGKLSPAKYMELRNSVPDMEKIDFDRITGSSSNAEKAIMERYSR